MLATLSGEDRSGQSDNARGGGDDHRAVAQLRPTPASSESAASGMALDGLSALVVQMARSDRLGGRPQPQRAK